MTLQCVFIWSLLGRSRGRALGGVWFRTVRLIAASLHCPPSFAHQFLVSEWISPANQMAHGRLGGRAPLQACRLRPGWPVPGVGAGGLSEHACQLRALRAVHRASPPPAFHGALDCGQPRLCASLPAPLPSVLFSPVRVRWGDLTQAAGEPGASRAADMPPSSSGLSGRPSAAFPSCLPPPASARGRLPSRPRFKRGHGTFLKLRFCFRAVWSCLVSLCLPSFSACLCVSSNISCAITWCKVHLLIPVSEDPGSLDRLWVCSHSSPSFLGSANFSQNLQYGFTHSICMLRAWGVNPTRRQLPDRCYSDPGAGLPKGPARAQAKHIRSSALSSGSGNMALTPARPPSPQGLGCFLPIILAVGSVLDTPAFLLFVSKALETSLTVLQHQQHIKKYIYHHLPKRCPCFQASQEH